MTVRLYSALPEQAEYRAGLISLLTLEVSLFYIRALPLLMHVPLVLLRVAGLQALLPPRGQRPLFASA